MPETVSVVIPAFNASRFIASAIESVISQTYEHTEIIVVDDGSGDDTSGTVRREFGDRVTVHRKENGGVSSARNAGVSLAKGDFIAFLDADDVWLPEKLSMQIDLMVKLPGCGVCYSDAFLSRSRTRGVDYPVFRDHGWSLKDIFEHVGEFHCTTEDGIHHIRAYWGNIFPYLLYNGMILPSTVLVRAMVIQQSGIRWNEMNRIAEDSEYFLQLANLTPFIYVDRPLVKYESVNACNRLSVSQNTPERILAFIKILEGVQGDSQMLPSNLRPWVTYCISRSFRKLGYYHLSEAQPRRGRTALYQAVRLWPKDVRTYLYLLFSLLPRPALKLLRLVKASLRLQG